MPEGHRFELIDGELVERNMSFRSSAVALEINARVRNYAVEHRPGIVAQSDAGLQIFPWDPGRVRFANGSFTSRERLPEPLPQSGHLKVAPDLVVEVVSPGDLASDIEEKVSEYLRAGVQLVWVAYPASRQVHVFRATRSDSTLRPEDVLDGEDVLPGFQCTVGDLFPAG